MLINKKSILSKNDNSQNNEALVLDDKSIKEEVKQL